MDLDRGWIKNEEATINPINKNDNKYFQYAVATILNHEEIIKDPQIISNIKRFIGEYNWKSIIYASEKDGLKTFEKNNPTIAPNVLYVKKA